MSIDKSPGMGRRPNRIPLGNFLLQIISYLVVLTPMVALPLFIWAVELGVCIRVFKEAFAWGYDFLGFR